MKAEGCCAQWLFLKLHCVFFALPVAIQLKTVYRLDSTEMTYCLFSLCLLWREYELQSSSAWKSKNKNDNIFLGYPRYHAHHSHAVVLQNLVTVVVPISFSFCFACAVCPDPWKYLGVLWIPPPFFFFFWGVVLVRGRKRYYFNSWTETGISVFFDLGTLFQLRWRHTNS